MNKPIIRRTLQILAICTLGLAGSVQARDYLVEVVLFETLEGREMTAGGLYYPKLERGLRLATEAADAAGFVQVELGLSLTENAASIANSRRYRLIRHLAWRQPGLDDDSAIPVRISLGNTIPLYIPDDVGEFDEFIPASSSASPERTRQITTSTVNGSIKVRLGRFLHMDTLLVYTDPDSQQSFRLSQSRKMRSRELHYIDNPRFGLLTRILPIEEADGSTDDVTLDDSAIEPDNASDGTGDEGPDAPAN